MCAQIKEENFKEVYRETYPETLKFIVIKCNNMDDINDILQDTYLELLLLLKKKKVLEIEHIHPYILGIANNIIKRHYHKKMKHHKVIYYPEKEENIEIKDDFDLEQEIITKDNVKTVWKYVKDKDIITSKIFYLYFSFGLKILEIAEELNLKESNVKNRIYRTLKELKEFLGKEVMENGK